MMPAKRRRWMHHYRELVKRQLLLNGGDKTHLAKNPMMSGWVDALIMRVADIQLSFPYLMVAIFISAIFQVAFGIGRYEELAIPLLVVIIGLRVNRTREKNT